MKVKQEKIAEHKQLTDKKQELLTKNSQKLGIWLMTEALQNLWQYKQFLDSLTPQTFYDSKKESKLNQQVRKRVL
jgi:hypothetical protein